MSQHIDEKIDVLAELDSLIAAAGLRVRFWTCPLHFGPSKPMTTVTWDGDEATCMLCGFTRSEHMRRLATAEANAGETLRRPR